MNFRVLFKSIRFAFRAKKRVLAFIIIYAILILLVGRGLQDGVPGSEFLYIGTAFVVSTVYAVLISQFRRKDIAILKCVSWSNSEILLLLIGEVILVSLSSFFIVFQISVEILGIATYFAIQNTPFIMQLQALLALEVQPLFISIVVVVGLQLPGLALAQLRAMNIPPMKALREE